MQTIKPLTPEEIELALRTGRALKQRADKHLPAILAKDLCRFAQQSGIDITDAHVRRFVNYLRANQWPIAANTEDGYWFTNKREEVIATADSLEHRIISIADAVRGLRQKAEAMLKDENDLFAHPTVQAIVEKFGAVPVEGI